MMLFFPNRQAALDLLDHLAAGGEAGRAMRRSDADPHRNIADAERARAMDAEDFGAGVERFGLACDGLALAQRHVVKRLVLELRHRLAQMVIADPAFKDRQRTRLRRVETNAQRRGIDGVVSQLKHASTS